MLETATRQDRRKARTRGLLLDAAEELFCSHGDATVEQIAATADVAVATVYAHFGGKDDLHGAVVERALEANEQHLLAVYESEVAPLDKLIDAAAAYLRFYLDSPNRFRLIALRHGRPATTAADRLIFQRVDRMNRALTAVIAQGVDDGSLREVDPVATAAFVWGAMNGVLGLSVRPDGLRLTKAETLAALHQGLQIILTGFVSARYRSADGGLSEELEQKLRDTIPM
jgi:AcrR family transcriptional regulator